MQEPVDGGGLIGQELLSSTARSGDPWWTLLGGRCGEGAPQTRNLVKAGHRFFFLFFVLMKVNVSGTPPLPPPALCPLALEMLKFGFAFSDT